MKKTLLLSVLIMLSCLSMKAQFAQNYYSVPTSNIIINDAVTVQDNSIYVCGQNTDNQQALLIHIDQSGGLLWWIEYPTLTHFQRMVAAQDNNDVLLLTNSRPDTGGVVSDFRWTVCRIDPAGTILWMNDYNCSNGVTNDVERGYFIAPATLNPNQYFIGGSFNSDGGLPNGVGTDDLVVLTIDGGTGGAGAVINTARFDNNDDEYRIGIENGNGGCVVIGDKTQGSIFGCLVDLNNNLNMVSNFRYTTNNTIIWDVDRIAVNDYVLLGALNAGANGDMYLMRSDATSGGAITWQIKLGVSANYATARVSIIGTNIYVSFVDNLGQSHVQVLNLMGAPIQSFIDPLSNGAALIIPQTISPDLYYINTAPNSSTLGTDLYVVSNTLGILCESEAYPPNYSALALAKTNENYTPDTPAYKIDVLDDTPSFNHTQQTSCSQQFCKYICNEDNEDYGRSIITTLDNEVAVLGTMFDAAPSSESDMYFAKLDNNLNFLTSLSTSKKIGDLSLSDKAAENGFSVMQASDGFYYLIGTTHFSGGNRDVYIVKLNPTNYAIVWAKNYGLSTYDDYGIKLVERINPNDPGLVVVGYRQFVGIGIYPHKIFAFRIDFNGVYDGITKTHIYTGGLTGANDDFAWDAIALAHSSDGIAIVGETNNGTDQNLLAFRISESTLFMIAPDSYHVINDGSTVDEAAYGIVEYDDKVYIVGKTNSSVGNGAMDACIVQLPSAFISISPANTNIYGAISDNFADECGYSIIKSKDNNLIVAGYKELYPPCEKTTRKDGLVFKVDIAGGMNLLWSVYMASTPAYQYNDVLFDLAQLPDGYIALTGYKGLSLTDNEFFISKLNSNGISTCCFADYPMNKEKGSKSVFGYNELNPVAFKDGSYKWDLNYRCEVVLCKEEVSSRIGNGSESFESSKTFTFDAAHKIQIYPNPNNGSFNLVMTNQDAFIQSYTIMDLSGRIILSKNINGEAKYNYQELSLPGNAPGIYFIEVQSSSERIRTKFIIE